MPLSGELGKEELEESAVLFTDSKMSLSSPIVYCYLRYARQSTIFSSDFHTTLVNFGMADEAVVE